MRYKLSQVDAVEFLRGIESESIDLVITDPPYESLEKYRSIGTTTRLSISKSSSNPWFGIFKNERFEELFFEVFRVLAKNSHFYLFCDQETMFAAKPVAEKVGFRFWKPLVWDKCRMGMGYHYRARYELILFFEKGRRKLNANNVSDILSVKSIRGGYPTEKPVELLEVLIKQSSIEEEIIADPFSGSGSVGVAALQNNRRFIGNDIASSAVRVCEEKLSRIRM